MTAEARPAAWTALAASRVVLLDFDGPVCSIFAGRAAPLIAHELADLLAANGTEVPVTVLDQGDPLAVLRYARRTGVRLARTVEQRLQAAELDAADSAVPTPGAPEFLTACRRTGRRVAMVSNNSAAAVARFLAVHRLAGLVAHIEGRDPHDVDLMKPHPTLPERALAALNETPDAAVLIGDSVTDVEAAQAVGVRVIGYANQPGKTGRLLGAGAVGVVASMTDLTNALSHASAT